MLLKSKLLRFFEDRPALKIKVIEQEAGIYYTGLSDYIKGKKPLSEKNIESLLAVIKKYGWKDLK